MRVYSRVNSIALKYGINNIIQSKIKIKTFIKNIPILLF